ncbi:hypothetical protein DV737_g4708, partial [Chaetothyriales sp. CBS 132003]
MATSAQSSASDTAAAKANTGPARPPPPKLSADDFRIYNRLAVLMDSYHNHLRETWNMLHTACSTSSRPPGTSIRAFLMHGLHLCRALTTHHTIEEQHVFPSLAERMPIFKPNDTLVQQHEQIHAGLDKFEAYLSACLDGEQELRMDAMKAIMDSFAQVLWTHLDLEVKMLGAENMRQYWTKDEILAMNCIHQHWTKDSIHQHWTKDSIHQYWTKDSIHQYWTKDSIHQY